MVAKGKDIPDALEIKRVRLCPECCGNRNGRMANCPRCGGCGLVDVTGRMLPAMVARTTEEAWDEHDNHLDDASGR
jgi:DnaJ-class molecular chaperone